MPNTPSSRPPLPSAEPTINVSEKSAAAPRELHRTDVAIPSGNVKPAEFSFTTSPPLEHAVGVIEWWGEEAISELYSFTVHVTGEHAHFALDSRLDQRATLVVTHCGYERFIHGVVASIEHVASNDASDVFTAFQLVPELWFLTQRANCRIFQDMSTVEIVAEVLRTAGVYGGDRVRWDLTHRESYVKREYCVQYRESDFDFIARLLEDEGIFFYFDHPPDQPEVLVFRDSNQLETIEAPATVAYHDGRAMQHDDEHVLSLRVTTEARSTATRFRDYNYLEPGSTLERDARVRSAMAREVYDFAGEYDRLGEGRRRAQVKLDALRARTVRGAGEAIAVRFVPGHSFTLTGHPRVDLDQTYALWRVEHHGYASEEALLPLSVRAGLPPRGQARYQTKFECTPISLAIRPPRNTPRPHVYGSETARVVGPGGEEIFTDSLGRIKVHFHWDREGQSDGRDTCWIRVAQSWAGQGWGALVIPRVGMEVVVDFLQGNPDRPLVTGCVYNGMNPTPNPLPAEKTRSTFRTNSSPGGGGFNEFTFEDLAGQELVYLRAQKDHTELVLHDHAETVNHDETIHVLHDQGTTVDHNQKNTVGHDQTEQVGNIQSLTVGVDRHKTVGANETTRVGVNQVHAVGVNRVRTVGGTETVAVGGSRTIEIGGPETIHVGASQTVNIGANHTVVVGGNRTVTVQGAEHHTVLGTRHETITGHRSRTMHAIESNTVSAGRTSTVMGFDNTMVLGVSSTEVVGQHMVTALTGSMTVVLASTLSILPTTISASAPAGVSLVCGSTKVELTPGKISFDTGKGATMVLDGEKIAVNGKEILHDAKEKATVKSAGNLTLDGAETVMTGSPVRINC